MNDLARIMGLVALAPLIFFPAVLIVGLLTGAIRADGLWRDSFDRSAFSPARVFEFMAALAAAAAVLIGLARSGGTAFAPLPEWLLAATGGGNAAYLGAKWTSSRRAKAGGS